MGAGNSQVGALIEANLGENGGRVSFYSIEDARE